jgi:hypothetical protein
LQQAPALDRTVGSADPEKMKVRSTLVFVAGFLTGGFHSAFAQNGTIAGKVLALGTREPIESVTLSIAGTLTTTATAPNGAFTLLSVPPGTYTVIAKRVGFATVEMRGIEVLIDRTREINFTLRPSRSDSVEVINFEPGLVDPGIVTSLLTLNAEKVLSLPSVALAGALGVNGGYVQLPRSGANLSLADYRRGITAVPSVRGARPEATLYILDGIEVNNPLFGMLPILAEPLATSGVSFSPAHVDAEYGGALSGLVTQALREGGDQLAGAFEYQTSTLAGVFGSKPSAVSGASALRGYVSGPMPVRPDAFRFSLAGHFIGDRVGVIQEGDSWRGSGDNAHQQAAGKLTYSVSSSLRLSLSGLAQRRGSIDVDPGFIGGTLSAPGTMHEDAQLVIARAEKRFARTLFSVTYANTHSRRQTCSIWQGVCVEDRIQRIPGPLEHSISGVPPRQTPYDVSGQFYGGEQYRTNTLRADLVLQASDHNQIKAGMYSSRYNIGYADVIGYRVHRESVDGDEISVVSTIRDVYRARPVEFSSYAQNVFETDFITVHFGVRYDYAKSPGVGFTDPLQPTNGTTAKEVCEGTVPGISETPFRFGSETGLAACFAALNAGVPALFDSAARLAQADDYRPATPRVAFSPRIGISFPVTEQSALFINYGRYARNPLYHDMYRYTGIGTRSGLSVDDDRMCDRVRLRPGTNECNPSFTMPQLLPEFIGNPLLPYQIANAWEAGFASRLGRVHSINVSFFMNDQDHLPNVRSQEQTPDPGATYGAIGNRSIRTAVSTAWVASNGVSVTIRRRLQNALAYSFNYTYERSSESGASPDLIAEQLASGAPNAGQVEHNTTRNRPHLFNAEASLQWRDNAPRKFGRAGKILLGNSRTTVTVSAASGSVSPLASEAGPGRDGTVLTRRVKGTSNLINLLYSKAIAMRTPQLSFVLRVQNLLNADDGSSGLINLPFLSGQTGAPMPTTSGVISYRRILSGMVLTF